MAGVKGKSGGPRANAGGARPGAGRKPNPKPELVPIPVDLANATTGESFDPRPTLERVALGLLEVTAQQYKALTALLPYVHKKLGEGGKKDDQLQAAKTAGKGKFASRAAPRLVHSK